MRIATLLPLIALALAACSPAVPGPDPESGPFGQDARGASNGLFLPGMDLDIASLTEARPSETIDVADGETIRLDPTIVRKNIGGREIAMYGYNGQIPGPMLRARQGATFTVDVTNGIDMPTSVHWHGLRLDNASDGVVGLTQEAIEPGGSFRYTVTVPDEGYYWYHPHVREDIQQDMGLYGLIHVLPEEENAYPPVDRTETVILDDLLLGRDGLPVPYGADDATLALMGRFGNLLLTNASDAYAPSVRQNDVVRFAFLNAANTRTYRLSFDRASMKIVGSDGGRVREERMVDELVLSPSERVIVDVLFDNTGPVRLRHRGTSVRDVATITVERGGRGANVQAFRTAATHDIGLPDEEAVDGFLRAAPDKTLRLSVEWAGMMGRMDHGMMDHGMMGHGGDDGGIEWEDTMPMMNAMSGGQNTEWKLIDEETGKENMDIDWAFETGDLVKIRIVNDPDSDHPMQHPIHLHGQRFIVLSEDGVPSAQSAWKDTVLVPTGATTDILVEVTNPGAWMFHCHIAEHLSNGMMGKFTVR